MARLQEVYNETLIPKLSEKLGIKNRHAIPRLMKIVVSMGVGKATQDRKRLEDRWSVAIDQRGNHRLRIDFPILVGMLHAG